jgi:hypothetical protein
MNTPTKIATWKVLRWENKPTEMGERIFLECECGQDAAIPSGILIGANLIAITQDNHFVFDPAGFTPPANWLPDELQCRKCGCRLVSKVEEGEEA